MSLTDIQTRRLGTDVALPLDPDGDIALTNTGDLATVTGVANLQTALPRRCCVSPGTLVHRPDFGGGLIDQVSAPVSIDKRSAIASDLRRNLLRDARLSEARVAVSRPAAGRGDLEVRASARIRGDTAESLSFAIVE